MGNMLQDMRYGIRMLVKNPGFTLVAVLALALGIGANTAIFSVVNAVLLRPLPYENSDRIMQVWTTNIKRGMNSYPVSYLNFKDLKEQSQNFEAMAAYSDASAAITFADVPEQIEGVGATADLFKVLAAKPVLGRTFLPEDESPSGSHVVVLGYGLWKRRFNADPNIVGKQIKFDGESTTVIGVMPEGFRFPLDQENSEFWIPLDPEEDYNKERGANYLRAVGRLKPGVNIEQAQGEMTAIGQRLEQQYPNNNTGRGVRIVSLYEQMVGNIRPALLILLGAVGFVLLIACANVANLLLARASSRQKEIAIRTALGASRWRIISQLLTESLLLALMGGVVGLLIAFWGADLLGAAIPSDIPRIKEMGLDLRVLGFTTLVSILTGLVFGLVPALQASKPDLNEALKEGGRGSTEGLRRNRTRSLLVVSEVALSLVLLIGAGLLIKSFVYLLNVKPGFDPEHVVTAGLALPPAKYGESAQQAAFFHQVLEKVEALPGVESAAVITPLPLSGSMMQNVITIAGRPAPAPGERLTTSTRLVSPNYLRTMGIPLIRGRAFTEQDKAGAPRVFLINETLARQYFPNEDPIGKRIKVSVRATQEKEYEGGEIVGIVGDVKHQTLDKESGPECYVPYLQVPDTYMTLAVRTKGEPMGMAAALRTAIQQVDPEEPVFDIATMNQVLARSIATRRFNMLLLGIFAALALILAAVGIFGVMNYSVTQRTHEIGIRMALGAGRTDVLRMILRQGMLFTLLGVGLGLLAAFALTRLMTGLLVGVSATDPITYAGVALLLIAVALLACYIPARRATRVDPMIALRYE